MHVWHALHFLIGSYITIDVAARRVSGQMRLGLLSSFSMVRK